jgi:transcriptional regulator with XRE-family HTH domain
MTLEMEVGQRLKDLRSALDFSQREIADLFGSTQQTWADYESERSIPHGSTLARLAGDHYIDLNWLLTGRGKMFIELGDGDDLLLDDPQLFSLNSANRIREDLVSAAVEAIEIHLDQVGAELTAIDRGTLVVLICRVHARKLRNVTKVTAPDILVDQDICDILQAFIRQDPPLPE